MESVVLSGMVVCGNREPLVTVASVELLERNCIVQGGDTGSDWGLNVLDFNNYDRMIA
jgi:hypothetical protein